MTDPETKENVAKPRMSEGTLPKSLEDVNDNAVDGLFA